MIPPIAFFVTRAHSYTLNNFLIEWEPSAAESISIYFYEDVRCSSWRPLFGQTIIFSDLDRLVPDQMRMAITMADRAMLSGERVLNHPAKFTARLDLNQRLHRAGLNTFNGFRLKDLALGARPQYPVFIREETGHSGNLSPILRTPLELIAALPRQAARVVLGRTTLKNLLVLEYEDVSDPSTGRHTKYSYLKIGSRLIARHAIFSSQWVVKTSDLYGEQEAVDEAEFIRSRLYAHEISVIFDLAGIEYGRIDFSVSRETGRIQVWEINTNPNMAAPKSQLPELRIALQSSVAAEIGDAFRFLRYDLQVRDQDKPISDC